MQLILTRPLRGVSQSPSFPQWFEALDERIERVSLPLLEVVSLADKSNKRRGRQEQTVILSSAETLNHLRSEELLWVQKGYVVGQKTAEALLQKKNQGSPLIRVAKGQSLESLFEEFGKELKEEKKESPLWYPCSAQTPWNKKRLRETFAIDVDVDPRYDLKKLYPPYPEKSGRRAWLYLSGSAVEAAASQPTEFVKKLKDDIHLGWGETAQNALKELNWKFHALDHRASAEDWIQTIHRLLILKETL